MIGKVEHPERVLNTHYRQPPELDRVELMSCGKTDEGVIDALMEKLPRYGLVPFRVRRSKGRSTILQGRPDSNLRALTGRALHRELSAQSLDPFAHGREPDARPPGAGVEAPAVVYYLRDHRPTFRP